MTGLCCIGMLLISISVFRRDYQTFMPYIARIALLQIKYATYFRCRAPFHKNIDHTFRSFEQHMQLRHYTRLNASSYSYSVRRNKHMLNKYTYIIHLKTYFSPSSSRVNMVNASLRAVVYF